METIDEHLIEKKETIYTKYLNGITLFIVAIVSFFVLAPICFLGGLVILAFSLRPLAILRQLNKILRDLATAIDQMAQPICYVFFNKVMVKSIIVNANKEWELYGDLEFEFESETYNIDDGRNFTPGYLIYPVKFGNIDETLSSVYGKNEALGTLTMFGRFFMWVLNTLDKDHGKKSIETDEN